MVKGAAGFRRCDLLSMLDTVKRPPSSAAFRRSAVAWSAMSNLSSFLPPIETSLAWKVSFLAVGELGQDRPIFLRLESLDLELAVADEPERHRLHAARRTGAGQLPPQHGGKGEAHEIIERAAGEIGIDQGPVDRARVAHGVEHRLLGDGVEHHPLDRDACKSLLAVEHLEHMPGDGLALAIGVGGEDQLAGALDGLGDLVEALRRLGLNVPMHLEVVVWDDRAVLRGQIADMAVGGDDAVSGPQIFIDGLCLGGQFDDDDVH